MTFPHEHTTLQLLTKLPIYITCPDHTIPHVSTLPSNPFTFWKMSQRVISTNWQKCVNVSQRTHMKGIEGIHSA